MFIETYLSKLLLREITSFEQNKNVEFKFILFGGDVIHLYCILPEHRIHIEVANELECPCVVTDVYVSDRYIYIEGRCGEKKVSFSITSLDNVDEIFDIDIYHEKP